MSELRFRLANPGEDASIIQFINTHFDMRLPLVNLPQMYGYYYKAAGPQSTPQFAVAEQGGELLSVAGCILANASHTTDNVDLWVSVWVAAPGHNGVGLELMEALPGLVGARVVACNNIRPETMAFYRFLGWHADRLHHYYRLGTRPALQLAQNPQPAPPVQTDLTLRRVESAEQLAVLGLPPTPHTPFKDVWYLQRRYFAYPWFTYDVWAAQESGRLLAYVVTRTVPVSDTGCVPVVRLVDYIGTDEVLPRLAGALDRILQDAGAEYIDCYNAGIAPEIWQAAGFCERREDDGTIIPNYLAPPLPRNTEYYYFTNEPEGFVMFKADGDQDRPNLTV